MSMEDMILKAATNQGFFAVMFVSLLVYQLKENKANQEKAEKREEKLVDFLEDMKDQFASLVRQYERLSDDVEEIRKKIDK